MITKPKKSSNAVIDSDSDGEENGPGKGSGGLDERASARKIVASSSDEDDEVRNVVPLTYLLC